ncbi:MAG: hypothetical protein L6R42_010864, partial [Xanthoria sp. 1 TBL-2021]
RNVLVAQRGHTDENLVRERSLLATDLMRRAGQEAFTAQPLEGEGTKRDATVIVVGRDRG